MRTEIERKFLTMHEGWRREATHSRHLRDGLVGQFDSGKVRVRLDDERAWLTVKGARQGLSRSEFEYEIPRADAQAMLATVCVGSIIEKRRYCVPHEGAVWEVDVYDGDLSGVVLAEIELTHEAQDFARPDWLGREVTGEPQYRQATLLRASRAKALAAGDAIPPP